MTTSERRNPYRAPDVQIPLPPVRLNYPYTHVSGGAPGMHPPHSGSCVDFDNWVSPWELNEPHYLLLEDLK